MDEDKLIQKWWFKLFLIPAIATLFFTSISDVTHFNKFFPTDIAWVLSRGLAISFVWITTILIVFTIDFIIQTDYSHKQKLLIFFSIVAIALCFGVLNIMITSNSLSVAVVVSIYCTLVFSGQLGAWIYIYNTNVKSSEFHSGFTSKEVEDIMEDPFDVRSLAFAFDGIATTASFFLWPLTSIISGVFTSFILWASFSTNLSFALAWGVSSTLITLIIGGIIFFMAASKK